MEKINKDPKSFKGLPTVFDFYTEVCGLWGCLTPTSSLCDPSPTRTHTSSHGVTTRQGKSDDSVWMVLLSSGSHTVCTLACSLLRLQAN